MNYEGKKKKKKEQKMGLSKDDKKNTTICN